MSWAERHPFMAVGLGLAFWWGANALAYWITGIPG